MTIRLDFAVEEQLDSHLCWAAVACSIARYYGVRTVDQREFVIAQFGSFCNRFTTPADALRALAVFRESRRGPLELDSLEEELSASRIIVARIAWQFGGAHLIALSGINDAEEVWVEDPRYGNGFMPYSDLCNHYFNFGAWTHTYLTDRDGSGKGAPAGIYEFADKPVQPTQ